jgi:plasmid stabilization system protein ParE
MSYVVAFTEDAVNDITRLYGFLLELAETLEDLDLADSALKVIRETSLHHLSTTPYSYRKVGPSPTLRELIIPFASTGYVVRFEIRSPQLVLVIGARHQREEDFH